MMRIASFLLVAVLLSTCAISGTFAKYVTESEGSDNARVAYWGWNDNATLEISGLFDKTYTHNTNGTTVKSTDNVVAPGTSNTKEFSFVYTGNTEAVAPEVKYEFKVAVQTSGDTRSLDGNPNFKWTLKAANANEAQLYNTVADLCDAIKKLSGADNGICVYEAGTLPSGITGGGQVCEIGWIWLFDENDSNNTWSASNNNSGDTAMGNATTLDNITITITITATQLD